MARPHNPSIRENLVERALDYVLQNGLTGLSLRPLAEELGTSARMLVYHFGSREGLMRAILEGLRKREDERIQKWFRARGGPRTLADFVRWYWKRVSAEAARPALLLVFELYALALRHPQDYPGVLEDPIAYWKGLVQRAGITGAGDTTKATLALAALRGLLLDLAATGDRARIGKAVRRLAESLEEG